MKTCIVCNKSKDLGEFYKQKGMLDGHLNKCKECCKSQSKERQNILIKDETWRETEKIRSRDKYHRLGYKDKHKPSSEDKKKTINLHKKKYPEKYLAKNRTQNLPRGSNNHLHHWSYNEEHYIDIIELNIADHNLLHRHMIYDQERRMYRNLKGVLLDSKQSHLDLLEEVKKN